MISFNNDNLDHISVDLWDNYKYDNSKVNILVLRVSLRLSEIKLIFFLRCLIRWEDLVEVDQYSSYGKNRTNLSMFRSANTSVRSRHSVV